MKHNELVYYTSHVHEAHRQALWGGLEPVCVINLSNTKLKINYRNGLQTRSSLLVLGDQERKQQYIIKGVARRMSSFDAMVPHPHRIDLYRFRSQLPRDYKRLFSITGNQARSNHDEGWWAEHMRFGRWKIPSAEVALLPFLERFLRSEMSAIMRGEG